MTISASRWAFAGSGDFDSFKGQDYLFARAQKDKASNTWSVQVYMVSNGAEATGVSANEISSALANDKSTRQVSMNKFLRKSICLITKSYGGYPEGKGISEVYTNYYKSDPDGHWFDDNGKYLRYSISLKFDPNNLNGNSSASVKEIKPDPIDSRGVEG